MQIDWITWTIWLVGFVILVVWIWVPFREFRRLYRTRSDAKRAAEADAGEQLSSRLNGGDD